jgi:glycosyltransferase involved in cell wall biosynthesis
VRVALVHDYLNQYGGAERVLEILHELYPDAPIYTSIFDPTTMPRSFQSWDIRTSFLQRIPLSRRIHRTLLPLYPLAFESFDFSGYDVVLSNSSAWAKGVITPPQTLHVCYCLSPMRWAWSYDAYIQREQLGRSARRLLPPVIHYLRLWDVASAQRVDRFIGISRVVRDRIAKYYRRDADLIFPPVDAARIPMGGEHGDEYLVVSRLIPYKRIDLAVAACTRLGLPLRVIGDGRDRPRLTALAGPTVRFAGRLPDHEVHAALGRCRAFIFPGEEDFGIAPVEAMAAGRPVIAYAGGGALDTVAEHISGRFFAPQTVDALADMLTSWIPESFDPPAIRAHAMQFDTGAFQNQTQEYVAAAHREHQARRSVATHERASV